MKYTATLSCVSRFTGENHTIGFNTKIGLPMRGDRLWCVPCQAEAVVTVAPYEWTVRCRSCTYTRARDTGETRARQAAVAHQRRKPAHRVEVRQGPDVVAAYPAREDTLKKDFEELCENLLRHA